MSVEKEPFHSHSDFFVPKDETSGVVFGHLHGTDGMSGDEIRHRVAEEHGVDPSDVSVVNTQTGEISTAPQPTGERRSRSYGFTKWNAPWEPAGPSGNPNLN